MNDIIEFVEKITTRIKSGAKAREVVANFLKENNSETNWRFIIAFREKVRSSKIGRRAKKKIAEIDEEILNYICSFEEAEGVELDGIFIEIIGIYENILRNELLRKMEEKDDIPLALIPLFWQYKEMLIVLNGANIGTLNELIACDQSTLMELFRYDSDALAEIVLLFKPLGIEFNIAHA